ncbi:hypothetical protein EG68_08517 [Paragonimus skrjabini miyazakii]|uniref:Uncharacterized protein n=1 Tax=Paragonimus skrjabini miyazakii TaxID=59628 RepID=A0A8S9YF19_9TREM|nr:hypothetical protein EG68_08517 [Paragonimus skrjabini miyazakii]
MRWFKLVIALECEHLKIKSLIRSLRDTFHAEWILQFRSYGDVLSYLLIGLVGLLSQNLDEACSGDRCSRPSNDLHASICGSLLVNTVLLNVHSQALSLSSRNRHCLFTGHIFGHHARCYQQTTSLVLLQITTSEKRLNSSQYCHLPILSSSRLLL